MTQSKTIIIATSANNSTLATHFRDFALELKLRGHRVVLLVNKNKPEFAERYRGVDIATWPSNRPTRLRDLIFFAKLIHHYNPQCIVANFGASNIMLLTAWAMRVPFRIEWYHTISRASELDTKAGESIVRRANVEYKKLRKRFVYRFATHIVANSFAASRDIQAVYGVPKDICTVQYYTAPDPQYTDNMSRTQDILCIGRLHPTKGQEYLIQAFSRIHHIYPHLKIDFVGDGPELNNLKSLGESLSISHKCTFHGACRPESVYEWMRHAPFTVVPSRSEAFGLVALESLSVGTPVVASDAGGLPEIVRDGVDGLIFHAEDVDSLVSKLSVMLENPELRQQMGKSGRQRFLDHFERTRNLPLCCDWIERQISFAHPPPD